MGREEESDEVIFFPKKERRRNVRFHIGEFMAEAPPIYHGKERRKNKHKASTHGVKFNHHKQRKKDKIMNDGSKETCNHCDGECINGTCIDCAHNNRKDS